MPASEEINADMLAFWNGKGGDIWVARQEHTDITLAPVTDGANWKLPRVLALTAMNSKRLRRRSMPQRSWWLLRM